MIQELIKFENKIPQNIKTYSFGIVFGLKRLLAITDITIPNITLVIEESTDAAICKAFVMSIIVEILEQKS